MAWFKPEVDLDSFTSVLTYGDETGTQTASIGANATGTVLMVFNGFSVESSSTSWVIGEWNHLACIVGHHQQGGTARMRLYLNGIFIFEKSDGIPSDVENQRFEILGIAEANESITGLGAEFKWWPFALQGGSEQVRVEMWTKGPVYQPGYCIYFPLDNKYRLNDGQGWGLQLTKEFVSGDGPNFDPEHPPGLLPASFFQRRMMQHNPAPDADTVFPRPRQRMLGNINKV